MAIQGILLKLLHPVQHSSQRAFIEQVNARSSLSSYRLILLSKRNRLLRVFGVANFLVEETDDLAGNVLSPGLLVVHDTSGGGKDDVAELTGRKELDNPLLEVTELDVVAGRDDAGLVETAVQLDDDLAGAVIVNLLELADVA